MTWPKNANDTTSGEGYSLSLVGSKTLITRNREVMKLFYPNLNKDRYDINGSKLGLSAGMCVMENTEIYKMKNEVVFTTMYEYF